MTLAELLSELGGHAVVAERLGLRRTAVTMWVRRGEIAAEHRNRVWMMALDAGIDWTPPGAEDLRDKLRAPGLPPARVA